MTHKALVFSDLHLEKQPWFDIPVDLPEYDVAIVAGDVARSPVDSMRILSGSPALQGRPILFLPGNHEFYGGILNEMEEPPESLRPDGVFYLHKRTLVHDGVRYVGATLWTDYALDGDASRGAVEALHGLNDHRTISIVDDVRARRFMPKDALARHVDQLAYIRGVLAEPFAGPTVVVTHHAPHPNSIEEKYRGSPVNPAFASDLSSTILEFGPELWIHGHVHSSHDYMVGRTRIVANPRGYERIGGGRVKVENDRFDPILVVEFDTNR